jgi:hypothetical protein
MLSLGAKSCLYHGGQAFTAVENGITVAKQHTCCLFHEPHTVQKKMIKVWMKLDRIVCMYLMFPSYTRGAGYPALVTLSTRLPFLMCAGRFRNWEIRVAPHADAPTSTRMLKQGYFEGLPLCAADPDTTRPGAYVLQVVCSKPVLGQYIIIRLVDSKRNATLHLCEVEPFVKDANASGEY